MKIQIFGSGCTKCKQLYEMTKSVIVANGIVAEVEYITDLAKMLEKGIMQSPALLINDKVSIVGRLPSVNELKEILTNYQES